MSTRLMWDNYGDYAATTITSSSENADLPAENVQHPFRTKVWRTGVSTASEWIKFDLGSARAVQAVVLLDHTLTGDDSAISLQGNATDSWGSPSVNETLTYNAEKMIKVLSAAQTYRYWRVIFTKASAGVYRDIGRIFLGPVYTCERLPDYGGVEIESNDLSVTGRSLGGQTFSDIRGQYDEIGID